MTISRRALWLALPLLLGVVDVACFTGAELSTASQAPGQTTAAAAAVEETGPTGTSAAPAGTAATTIEEGRLADTPADQDTPAANVLEVDSKWTKYSLLGEILAPELVAITSSANAEPFTLASKRGDVIMIDFWTFACVNCIRTFLYLKEWHEKYADDGLIIVGVHYPEFDFERDMDAVGEAAKKYGLDYAIAQDNMGGTWRAYDNEYWPPLYLIDRQSNIRYIHIGEGDYEETDRKIRQMLAEPG